MRELKDNNMFVFQGGSIKAVYFAGLPKACDLINKEYKGFVKTFTGGESAYETLIKFGINNIPKEILEGCKYDEDRYQFGKKIIESQEYQDFKPVQRKTAYKEYGTAKDTLIKRLQYKDDLLPLIRAHVGPFSSSLNRIESVKEFLSWAKILADTGYLDILSIGTSQLTQSNFGEDWKDMPNGGGVPINSADEYKMVWEASRPLLVRTYSGTKNTAQLAEIYENTINICWHALSLWWFNRLDNRGPYDLYTNLSEHFKTIEYIAKTGKPLEPNVSHHFAFRGSDDVTYIVTAYLSAKMAKMLGIKTLVLQNMLNTPRVTWGIQDLAKSRAMLKLIRELEDADFKVILQPRAGLDYFSPDLNKAKTQLASVTALMDDIDCYDNTSPQIIHVVSFSEAFDLATPEIINESIKITLHSLIKYRQLKKEGKVEDMGRNINVAEREIELLSSARAIISIIENNVENVYSVEGFYKLFVCGFFPVPYLWNNSEEYKHAKHWNTKQIKGGIKVVDKDNKIVKPAAVAQWAMGNLHEAEYMLKCKNKKVIIN
jgi:hypothetical protein